MSNWKQKIDTTLPLWSDYRSLIEQLPGVKFPNPSQLNAVKPPTMVNAAAVPLRFVAASDVPGVAYEKHIYETGEISTREDNWHDLFNALVWFRLPRIKTAMNQMHHGALQQQQAGRRGKLRDALTLLDESGAIVVSSDAALLEALSNRDWPGAFLAMRDAWRDQTRVVICGHALLEKFLHPYKAMTAHVLLLHVLDEPASMSLEYLDELVATSLLAGALLESPADLSPLPLMGIPGWASPLLQDEAFYADQQVFRLPRENRHAAPVNKLHPGA